MPPVVVATIYWLGRHAVADVNHATLAAAWTLLSASIIYHMALANSPRRFTATPRQDRLLRRLFVTVNVPVYNEDSDTLRLVVCSLFAQTRLPDRVEVVVNGDKAPDYTAVIAEFRSLASFYPQVGASWVRTPVPGKRHAQARTFTDGGQADIFVTVDSDTILDSDAIANGLKPFADPGITSVAAVTR